jgi:hypothetical protein
VRIIVTGDRDWFRPAMAIAVLKRLIAKHGPDLVIVQGGASGVDSSFKLACQEMGIACEEFPARWDELGKRAGPVRDSEMVLAGAGYCLVFHPFSPRSKGSKDCASQAIEAGISTWLIDKEGGEPRRLKADDPRLE